MDWIYTMISVRRLWFLSMKTWSVSSISFSRHVMKSMVLWYVWLNQLNVSFFSFFALLGPEWTDGCIVSVIEFCLICHETFDVTPLLDPDESKTTSWSPFLLTSLLRACLYRWIMLSVRGTALLNVLCLLQPPQGSVVIRKHKIAPHLAPNMRSGTFSAFSSSE